jgi:hypothetical protein
MPSKTADMQLCTHPAWDWTKSVTSILWHYSTSETLPFLKLTFRSLYLYIFFL